ncbi:MAG: preprotein translocase subunit SecY [Candidatus Kerfeldbacteria bacterium]|nr:preprotein translocase subunit SecY [Candidatus Kerfeldbacteria bacterium]
MVEKLSQLWRVRDIRNRIVFVLGMLFVFRIAAHVPIPGVDIESLREFFGSNQLLGLLNIFSGGALENFSVVMLGVGPYITASIIMQLLTMIIPKLEEMQKEGEQGRQRINQWTRLLTVPMAILQSYATITLLKQQGRGIIGEFTVFEFVTAIVTVTAGTTLLMWIGELITEKKIGNGISLIIFAGIVASLPLGVQRAIATFNPSQLFTWVGFLVLGLVTIAGVVYVTEAQRNIPVSYARRVRGMRVYGGVDSHLPMRVNQAGVIPIIFAISLVLFPPLIAQFFVNSSSAFIATVAQGTVNLFNSTGFFYGAIYFILVVAFTYFYTAVIFHPQRIAENLQQQGGFVPGIRPGTQTTEYLQYVSNRIILAGALFLGVIAVLPLVVQRAFTVGNLALGGTSLLIVVSVVIETVKQVEAQLIVREYEGF